MTRRDTLLKLSGITGFPVVLAGCSMDAIRRAEAQLGDRLKHPGTGVQFTGLPEVVKVLVLATYPATPQQSQVAEQRARKAAVAIVRREGKRPAPSGKPKTGAVKSATVQVDEPAAAHADDVKTAAAILQARSGTTTVAVDTTPDSRQQGARTVMLWNTQTQRFVGNNVYDISSPPAVGQVAQWGNTTARYVGTGSL